MKFVTGLVTGIALGAAGAVYYSVRSGKDLRGTYEDVRAEIDARNYEALGQRIERGFAELQTQIEDRLTQVRAGANAALEDADDAVNDATEGRFSLDETDPDDIGADAEPIVDDVTDAIDSVEDAASNGAQDAAATADEVATDVRDAWEQNRT